MSSVVISGDTSGAITLAVPAVAGTNTATLPAATGTVMVSGNMPAFYATMSSSQTISASTNTKVQFNTKSFDTASCYDTTNYRFTPTVAGYYQINACIYPSSTTSFSQVNTMLWKNGSAFQVAVTRYSSTSDVNAQITALVYMNGSTDYLEVYGAMYTVVGTPSFGSASPQNWFSGTLVRAA